MPLRVRFPEREDALRGNVEIVNDRDERVAIGHLEVDGPVGAGNVACPVRFVGHAEASAGRPDVLAAGDEQL